jgi:hypothetical protein
MSFTIKTREEDKFMFCDGGMSAEIAFTKYVSHRTNIVYGGWNNSIRMVREGIITDTLNAIEKAVSDLEVQSSEKPIIISPGYISVPYITELCNCVYLPSHLLIGLNSISSLQKELDNLKEQGIKAYAEVGYDGCINHCLVAWIKFIEIPPQYRNVITYLSSDNVILSGVIPENGNTGENFFYKYYSNEHTGIQLIIVMEKM